MQKESHRVAGAPASARRPTRSGSFAIEAGGGVSRVTAVGVHPVVEDCVASVIGSLQFRPTIHGAEVNYPFTFRPVDDGEAQAPRVGE
jgi:hypothetical protein